MAHRRSVHGFSHHPQCTFWWVCLLFLFASPFASVWGQDAGPSRPQFPPLRGLGNSNSFGNALPKFKVNADFFASDSDQQGLLRINVELDRGWYIYSVTQPPGGPMRTTIDLQPSAEFQLTGAFRPVEPPIVEQSQFFPVAEEKHHGKVSWTVPIRFAKGVQPDRLVIQGKIDGQICRDGQCVPLDGLDTNFVARYAGKLPVSATSDQGSVALPGTSRFETVDQAMLIRNLVLGLIAGFLLNFMPCVLPVIGLKVMSFVQQSHGNRGEAFRLNLIYSLGVISVFLVLGVLAAQMNLQWGEQFSYTGFKIGLIVLVFAMALSFLGVWEIPIPGFIGNSKAGALAAREGSVGAFAKGVFATILATPCTGPLMSPLFAYALNRPPYVSYAIFLSLGLGMSLPYLVIGAFPELARWLPKPGAWMETFKQLMGFVLLFTVVFLFYALGDQGYFIPTLTLLVGVWFACWLVGRVPVTASTDRKVQSWVYGTATAAVVGMLAFRFLSPTGGHLQWQPFSPEQLATAQREGKTVMLDFTANWCISCKVNQAVALETQRVAQLVKEFDVVPMLADWSNKNSPQGQQVKQMLESLGASGIPLLAIYPASNPSEPVLLSALVTESQVLEALRQAGPSRSATATMPTSGKF